MSTLSAGGTSGSVRIGEVGGRGGVVRAAGRRPGGATVPEHSNDVKKSLGSWRVVVARVAVPDVEEAEPDLARESDLLGLRVVPERVARGVLEVPVVVAVGLLELDSAPGRALRPWCVVVGHHLPHAGAGDRPVHGIDAGDLEGPGPTLRCSWRSAAADVTRRRRCRWQSSRPRRRGAPGDQASAHPP